MTPTMTPDMTPDEKSGELAALVAAGWKRCFVADEPRLSEAVQTYEELGLEVRLLPVPEDDGECSACIRLDPSRFRLIVTRPRTGRP